MPTIIVEMLFGRTSAQKKALIKQLTAATVNALGVDSTRVKVSIREVGGGGEPIDEKTTKDINWPVALNPGQN